MKSRLVYIESLNSNISIIWLDNPPVNSISKEFLNQLNICINDIKDDKKIRCLLIGSKIKHFCAGADLKERLTFSNSETLDFLKQINSIFNNIEDLNIPVIAMLTGATLGGGAELSLSADFRIADSTLKFGFPETGLGIIPGAGGTYRLPKLLGLQRAKKMIYTGECLNFKKALEIMLIDDFSNTPIKKSIKLANIIIENSPLAISSAKHSINNNFNKDREYGLNIEQESYLKVLETKDRLEALKAFIEHRKPLWRKK